MALLTPDHVIVDSHAPTKKAIITELAQSIQSIDPDQVLEVVMARERLGSTGIGHGVAIPHGRIHDLLHPIVAVARHQRGVDFEAIDGEPVHIVVLLLVPDDDNRQHLELLAHLARLLQQPNFRAQIMDAADAESLAALFPEMASTS
ncbi:MAG: PTS sugar transporter subunit IIA [Zetaproteobacteria bacterium]|nr:MAG: PTS sugar transporter subunit IIA [Zetaproteobacteria bacterium]